MHSAFITALLQSSPHLGKKKSKVSDPKATIYLELL